MLKACDLDRACQLARALEDGLALERRHTAARDGGLRQQSAGAVAAAHGRAALVLLMRVAANSGRFSGWMRASTAAQARCMPPPPPAHPPRVPQAAAAARVAGKDDVWTAAAKGDTSLVGDHVLADDKCVNKRSAITTAKRARQPAAKASAKL